MSTQADLAFKAMCRKRGINPEGQFAQEDGYLFYDGYEAGVRDTHKFCDVEKLVQLEHHVVAVLREALDNVDGVHPCDVNDDRAIARRLPEPLRKLWELVYGPA